jgi:hypothetical protein
MRGSVRLGCSAILFSRFQLRETLPTQSGLRFVLTPVMRKVRANEPRGGRFDACGGKRTADDRDLIGAGSDAEGVECQNDHP